MVALRGTLVGLLQEFHHQMLLTYQGQGATAFCIRVVGDDVLVLHTATLRCAGIGVRGVKEERAESLWRR